MPDFSPVSPPQQVNLETEPYQWQELEDKYANQLVVQTFAEYERGRRTHEERWADAENLYFGLVEQRYWEGTQIPRSSLAVRIAFDQVEAAHPLIVEALLNHYPTFFDTQALPGSNPSDAAKIRDIIAAQFLEPLDGTGFPPVAHIPVALKQAQKYGDGAIEVFWDPDAKRWGIEFVDIRDLYYDTTAPGPLIDLSPSVIRRMLMTVEDLKNLRGKPGFKIPSDSQLNTLAKERYHTTGDLLRQRAAAARKEYYDPMQMRVDPKHQVVEVLVYWSKTELIWTLARKWVALDIKNPYGFIPFCKAPLVVVEGRPFSISMPEFLADEQRYIQGLRNLRLDNIALALQPPRQDVGAFDQKPTTSSLHPGMKMNVQNKDSLSEFVTIPNVTENAYRDEALIVQEANNRFGVNQSIQSGIPLPSNANRTATGVQAQMGAVGKRLQTVVKNFEDYMIVPLLYKIKRIMEIFAPETFQVTDNKGQTIDSGRADFQKQVKFIMTGADKMVVKDRLASFVGPITQMLFNQDIMHQANLQGKTVDFLEWSRFLQDATGTALSYQFFRDMNPNEEQRLQQPDPKTMAMLQAKQQDQQVRMAAIQSKHQTESQKNEVDLQTKTNESGEKSARELLKLLQGASHGTKRSESDSKSNK